MKSRSRRNVAPQSAIGYWDTSALVPLCCFQSQSAKARQAARIYSRQVVWWATSVEAIGAFNRLVRSGSLTPSESRQALVKLDHLRAGWNEVQPTEDVRHRAERAVVSHRLRAADAFQLAAALVWCSDRPRGRAVIVADGALSNAAESEGFTVIRVL